MLACDLQREAADHERLLEDLEDALGGRARPPRRSLASVSTTANSSPPRRATVSLAADRTAQPGADALEQLVAVEVAERVVDLLEAVEVHEHHRHEPPPPPSTDYGTAHELAEQRPVGKPGQRVVQGQVLLGWPRGAGALATWR